MWFNLLYSPFFYDQRAGKENYKRNNPDVSSPLSPLQTPRGGSESPRGEYVNTSTTTPNKTTTPPHTKTSGPTYSKKEPRFSSSSRPDKKPSSTSSTRFTFDPPKLKHVSNSVVEEPKEDYYDDVVPVSSSSSTSRQAPADVVSKSAPYSPRMHEYGNVAVASTIVIPEKVLQMRRNLSERSLEDDHVDSNKTPRHGEQNSSSMPKKGVDHIRLTSSHSKLFPAVKKSNSTNSDSKVKASYKRPPIDVVSKSMDERSATKKSEEKFTTDKPEKTPVENGEHKPVIVTKKSSPNSAVNNMKLPRVPIHDTGVNNHENNHQNIYQRVGRENSKKASSRKNILPDKPTVAKQQPISAKSSFKGSTPGDVYDEIPHQLQNGDAVLKDDNSDSSSTAPLIPEKTEGAYEQPGGNYDFNIFHSEIIKAHEVLSL